MTPKSPDQTLLDGLHAGQRDAFARLYAEYSAPIYNLCARVLCNREEAKDLTQDVFITAFDHLRDPGAEPVRQLRPWLYRVAANACYNHLRSRKRLDGGGDAQLENASCEVDEFERAETVALVEASLGQLNERYRTALVLKDLQGLAPAEIAEVMEVSRPTADVLVHRARASFKTAFARLAGDRAPAPAALGLVLLPIGLPAALQAMPPFPASFAPPTHAPVDLPNAPIGHGLHLPDLSTAGPAGAGLLTKIGTALTTKLGITAAAATLAVGGTVAVKEAQHSADHPWKGSPGHAWQAPSSQWDKPAARWSLYAHWDHHGWPMGWNSGRWAWDHHAESWSWHMSDGSSWSCDGARTPAAADGSSWTVTESHSGSSGWSSGSHDGGSGSSSHESSSGGSGSGSGSHDSGSWSGSSSSSGSHTSSGDGSGDAHGSDGSSRDSAGGHSGSDW